MERHKEDITYWRIQESFSLAVTENKLLNQVSLTHVTFIFHFLITLSLCCALLSLYLQNFIIRETRKREIGPKISFSMPVLLLVMSSFIIDNHERQISANELVYSWLPITRKRISKTVASLETARENVSVTICFSLDNYETYIWK